MDKLKKLQNNHYVILSQRIIKELKENFLFDYIKDNFKRLDKLKNEPLKLAILGEFNAGKTTFINRLLNLSLPTKRIPTTKVITIIKYSEKEKFEIEYKDKNSDTNKYSIREYEGLIKLNETLENISDLIEVKEIRVYINNSILKTFEIIDTPGFNDSEFEPITKALFNKVNFAIWIFNASQTATETEIVTLEEFRKKSIYQNNIYAFINQADIIEESEVESIKENLKQYKDYFMNDKILAISAKRKGDKWDLKYKELIEDLKTKVLNKDIEISEKQIQNEYQIIKNKLIKLKDNFNFINNEIINYFDDFNKKYPNDYENKLQTSDMIFKQIKNDIKEIQDDVKIHEIFKNKYLKNGIKFLSFYKTFDKLDDFDNNLKKIYFFYIQQFKKDFNEFKNHILNQIDNKMLLIEEDFDNNINKKFDKISFILDMLKETKQLLIVGYIIGILTDDYIYKNLEEKDIFKTLNKDVILNLINLDLDISYFIEEIEKMKQEIKIFFEKYISLLNNITEKE